MTHKPNRLRLQIQKQERGAGSIPTVHLHRTAGYRVPCTELSLLEYLVSLSEPHLLEEAYISQVMTAWKSCRSTRSTLNNWT